MAMNSVEENQKNIEKKFQRMMLRAEFVSLIWNAFSFRAEAEGLTKTRFAEKIGINKSAISRWFSFSRPNWRIDTISDISRSLGMELEIRLRDPKSGMVFTPTGIQGNRYMTLTDAEPTKINQIVNAQSTVSHFDENTGIESTLVTA